MVNSLDSGNFADVYNDECEWDSGLSTNVAACVLWFVTGVYMMIIGPPAIEELPPAETQEVTYQQTQNPDGTTTTAEVAVVKGTAVPKEEAANEKSMTAAVTE